MRNLITGVVACTLCMPGCKDGSPTEPIKQKVLITSEVIYFTSDRDGKAKNIFMMTTEGEILKQITHFEWGEYVATAVSPDSSQLLFYQSAPGLDIDVGMDIYIYKIREDTIIGPVTAGHPGNFTPDGQSIVFHRHTFVVGDGYESVYLLDLRTHSEKKLTADGFSCFYPQLSPDGKTICYETSEPPFDCTQLHLMDIQGGYVKPLIACQAWSNNPVFSPDGKYVLASSNQGGWCYDIVKIDIETGDMNLVTTQSWGTQYTSCSFKNPAVSQDGKRAYFYSIPNDLAYPRPHNIYVSNIDGSGLKNLNQDDYWDSHPVVATVTCYVEK